MSDSMGGCAVAKNAEKPRCLISFMVNPALRGAQLIIKLIIYWFQI